MKTLPLEELLDNINKIFLTRGFVKQKNNFDYLNFDKLIDLVKQSNFKYKISLLDNWEDFEYGNLDWTELDFKNMVLSGVKLQKEPEIKIITDECINNNIYYSFSGDEYNEFVKFYSNTYNLEFFQPNDYILLTSRKIIALNHEGSLCIVDYK